MYNTHDLFSKPELNLDLKCTSPRKLSQIAVGLQHGRDVYTKQYLQ